MSVKVDYPDEHPLSANLIVLDAVFGAANRIDERNAMMLSRINKVISKPGLAELVRNAENSLG